MAIYTVNISSAGSSDVVSLTDGSTYATLEVSAGRGPKGDGFTGGSYDSGTGVVTFASNDGIGFSTGDIRQEAVAAAEAAQAAAELAQTGAETAEAGAEAAQAATESIFDQFGDQYLGPKASDPTVDNDGDPLTAGDIYFNTTDSVLKFYSGSAWVAPESIATTAASDAQAAQAAAETAETNAETAQTAAETAETNASTSETNAATSEANAANSAAASANSATAAAASATAAATSETNASASESNAAASEANAANSETNAATSETNAATSETNAATSESNAASSASAAANSASAAATSEANADTSEANALTYSSNAATSAAQAASSAAGIAGYDLDVIAETKGVTAVDVFVYDTSKDSDGGAWRKRTQGTSWYNETLNTATRGSRREFPAVAVIVAEAAKVTIYDGDNPSLPMWMVFNKISSGKGTSYMGGAVTSPVSSISMQNGNLCVGSTGSWADLRVIYFLSDKAAVYRNDSYTGISDIAKRNSSIGVGDDSLPNIVNDNVNDIAMTVLPDAPIDPATGLPVPTIAVATDGGVSVIKDDGTVVSSSDTSAFDSVAYTHDSYVALGMDGSSFPLRISQSPADNLSAGWLRDTFKWNDPTAQPAILDNNVFDVCAAGKNLGIATAEGLQLFDVANESYAWISPAYNTGWMNGDIKGAFLSDTDDTDLVGSGELVTNGTFDTDTSGWTSTRGAALSYNSGTIQVSGNNSTAAPAARQVVATVAGKVYAFEYEVTATDTFARVGVTNGVSDFGTLRIVEDRNIGVGKHVLYFVALSSQSSILMGSESALSTNFVQFDNVSVKLADEDRSVNNNGLVINGTVSRDPVSSGADLVAYSGFSASNYLEQPYNPDLDFGTGDFCVMGWVKINVGNTDTFMTAISRVAYNGSFSGSGFEVSCGGYNVKNKLLIQVTDDGYSSIDSNLKSSSDAQSAASLAEGVWNFVVFKLSNQTGYVYLNAEEYFGSGFALSNAGGGITTNTSAKIRVGFRGDATTQFDNGALALWRISATAPTADQIAKIYNDEKVLFEENAQATLYGSSDAVTALAHDPDTDLLHVGTSAGRSVFRGLERLSNTTTSVSTAISATGGLVISK